MNLLSDKIRKEVAQHLGLSLNDHSDETLLNQLVKSDSDPNTKHQLIIKILTFLIDQYPKPTYQTKKPNKNKKNHSHFLHNLLLTLGFASIALVGLATANTFLNFLSRITESASLTDLIWLLPLGGLFATLQIVLYYGFEASKISEAFGIESAKTNTFLNEKEQIAKLINKYLHVSLSHDFSDTQKCDFEKHKKLKALFNIIFQAEKVKIETTKQEYEKKKKSKSFKTTRFLTAGSLYLFSLIGCFLFIMPATKLILSLITGVAVTTLVFSNPLTLAILATVGVIIFTSTTISFLFLKRNDLMAKIKNTFGFHEEKFNDIHKQHTIAEKDYRKLNVRDTNLSDTNVSTRKEYKDVELKNKILKILSNKNRVLTQTETLDSLIGKFITYKKEKENPKQYKTLSKTDKKELHETTASILKWITSQYPDNPEKKYKTDEAKKRPKALLGLILPFDILSQSLNGFGIAESFTIFLSTIIGAISLKVIIPLGICFAALRVTRYLGFDLNIISKSLGISIFDTPAYLRNQNEELKLIKKFYSHSLNCDKNTLEGINNHQEYVKLINALREDSNNRINKAISNKEAYEKKSSIKWLKRSITSVVFGLTMLGGFLSIMPASKLLLSIAGITLTGSLFSNPVSAAVVILVGLITLTAIAGAFYCMHKKGIYNSIDNLFGKSQKSFDGIQTINRKTEKKYLEHQARSNFFERQPNSPYHIFHENNGSAPIIIPPHTPSSSVPFQFWSNDPPSEPTSLPSFVGHSISNPQYELPNSFPSS